LGREKLEIRERMFQAEGMTMLKRTDQEQVDIWSTLLTSHYLEGEGI
jgi:hypothetical protein